MSQELEHEESRVGAFVMHDNGSIFWNTVHHVSWIGDDGKRAFAPNLPVLAGPDELAQCQRLAAQHDAKGAK